MRPRSYRLINLPIILIALLSGGALYLLPVSTGWTRLAGLCWVALVWLGVFTLLHRWRRAPVILVGATLLVITFLSLPARSAPSTARLREAYTQSLRHYEGVPYYWGGESARGIDCSGLVRQDLVDALLKMGWQTADPGLLRKAAYLWWHDTTAEFLGQAHAGVTRPVLQTASLNQLNDSLLAPGDLAVTLSGLHVLDYLGEREWIEADPAELRVLTIKTPAELAWFHTGMNVVRWELLQ